MRLIKVHDLVLVNGSRSEFDCYYLTSLSTVDFVNQYRAKIIETDQDSTTQMTQYFALLQVEEVGSLSPDLVRTMQGGYPSSRLFPET